MEEFKKLIKDSYESLAEVWMLLPAEARKTIKVSMYIALSYGLADVITALEAVKIDSTLLAIILNVVLAFLRELSKRLKK